jgi:23S rRNA pseudouridine1911/1915/1917 synthase
MVLTVSPEAERERLDRFVALRTGISRSQVKNLVERSRIVINGRPALKTGYLVRAGDVVEVTVPAPEPGALLPEDIPLNILYHDRDLVVVDKPPGMVVYPAAGHGRGTLMNAFRHRFAHLATIGAPLRPGVVHRLDKDTSGVMVVALSDRGYYGLVGQFQERSIERKYIALIYGNPREASGEISLSIGRSPADRKKMSTRSRRGKEAKTWWKVVRRFRDAAMVEARLSTGRTHQVRVHFAALGHPVLGDRTYGRKTSLPRGSGKISFPRQMLHAEILGFSHPGTGERLVFSAPPPPDMEHALSSLSSLNNRAGKCYR